MISLQVISGCKTIPSWIFVFLATEVCFFLQWDNYQFAVSAWGCRLQSFLQDTSQKLTLCSYLWFSLLSYHLVKSMACLYSARVLQWDGQYALMFSNWAPCVLVVVGFACLVGGFVCVLLLIFVLHCVCLLCCLPFFFFPNFLKSHSLGKPVELIAIYPSLGSVSGPLCVYVF